MSKKEFIDKLKKALQGSIHETDVQSNIEYYSDYIESEIRKGKTEEEVTKDLGSPNLIAKTIITTNKYGGNRYVNNGGNFTEENEDFQEDNIKGKGFKFNSWYFRAIALVVFAVIAVVLIAAGAAVTYVFARFAIPIIIIIVLVFMFRRR